MPVALSLLAVAMPLAIVGGILLFRKRAYRERREALQAAASVLRCEFRADGSPELEQRLSRMPLCTRGRNRRLSNVMLRPPDHPDLTLFDYRYIIHANNHSRAVEQTVVALELDRAGIPEFALHPEHVSDRIAAWFGGQDIDFEERPLFSKLYRLRGPREDDIRTFFKEPLTQWFEAHPGWSVETDGTWMLAYRASVRAEPVDLRRFMDEAREPLAQFQSARATP